MHPRGGRTGAPLFGALVGCYLVALVVAGVHGELLAGLVVGAGLAARLVTHRLNRRPQRQGVA